MKCAYCQNVHVEGATKCHNCGAPLDADAQHAPDYRFCPHCHRRLLALGSPACNYCGRALPDNYIKAREAIFNRINEARSPGEVEDLEGLDDDDPLRRALKSLFDLDRKSKR